jgi:hypothetical protein
VLHHLLVGDVQQLYSLEDVVCEVAIKFARYLAYLLVGLVGKAVTKIFDDDFAAITHCVAE